MGEANVAFPMYSPRQGIKAKNLATCTENNPRFVAFKLNTNFSGERT